MPCNRRRFLQSMAVTGAGLCLPTLGWAGFDPLWKPGTVCANPIDVTVFEMFKVGPGPSSSHTIAPMAAGNDFIGLCSKLPQDQLAQAIPTDPAGHGWARPPRGTPVPHAR